MTYDSRMDRNKRNEAKFKEVFKLMSIFKLVPYINKKAPLLRSFFVISVLFVEEAGKFVKIGKTAVMNFVAHYLVKFG
jgi:hypothetical protein